MNNTRNRDKVCTTPSPRLAHSRCTINVSLFSPLSKGESLTGTRSGYITAPFPAWELTMPPRGFSFWLENANSPSFSKFFAVCDENMAGNMGEL